METKMVLSLDNLASRYHCLPSEAMLRATTFDLYVLNVASRWERRQYEEESSDNKTVNVKEYSQEELMALLNKSKK